MSASKIIRAVLVAAAASVANVALAIDPEGNTDGFNPVAGELNQINESQRQDQIARQIDLNRRMIRSSGFGPRYPDPFEPWPRVPGDVWGYPVQRPIEQPIGHESLQTGPNRWLYRPLYATGQPQQSARGAPARPAPAARPGKVELPHPSDAEPEDFVPAAAGPRKQLPVGRREF